MSIENGLKGVKKRLYHSRILNPFVNNPFADKALEQTVDDLKEWHILLRRFFVYPIVHPMLPLKIGKKIVVDKKVRLNPLKSYIFACGHFFPEEIAANLSVIHKHVYTLIGTEDQVKNSGDMAIMWLYGFLFVDKLEKNKKGSRHDAELRLDKVIKYGGSVKIYLAGVLNNSENYLCGEPYSSVYNLANNCQQWYCRVFGKVFGNYEWFKRFSEKYGKVEVIPVAAHTSNNSDTIRIMYNRAVDKDGKPIDVTKMSREDFFRWFKDTISSFAFEMMKKEHDLVDGDRINSIGELEGYNKAIFERVWLRQGLQEVEESLELIELYKKRSVFAINDATQSEVIVTLNEKKKELELAIYRNSQRIEELLNIQKRQTIGGTFGNNKNNVVVSMPFVDSDEPLTVIQENVVCRATLGDDPRYNHLEETSDKYYDNNDYWTPNEPSIWDVELVGHEPRIEDSYRKVNGEKITGVSLENEISNDFNSMINNGVYGYANLLDDIVLWRDLKKQAEANLTKYTKKYLDADWQDEWWKIPELREKVNDDPQNSSIFCDDLILWDTAVDFLNDLCCPEEDPWSFYDRLDYRTMNNKTFNLLAPGAAKARVRRMTDERYGKEALKEVILDRHKK